METQNDKFWKVFFEVHNQLPREGPGDRQSTLRSLKTVNKVISPKNLLDIACGPGKQTMDLASVFDGDITAVDNHKPFLGQLAEDVAAAGKEGKVRIMEGDMTALPFDPGSFDLIWSEGAIYIMGFENGLRKWKTLLSSNGCLAISEAVWLKDNPPQPVFDMWQEYPGMMDIEGALKVIDSCGYKVLDHFTLPESAWLVEYYEPMGKRLELLRSKFKDDTETLKMLEYHQLEIDIYKEYSEYYGYEFFVLQNQG